MSARSVRVLLLCIAAFTAVLPASSSAHHSEGSNGRIAGQSDFKRFDGKTMRFIPSEQRYEVRSPGEIPGFVHVDGPPPRSKGPSFAEPVIANEDGPGQDLPTQELSPICRYTGNRIVVLYTHRPGETGPAPVETIRSIVRRMNWKIADQSSLSSGGARSVRMAVDCDGSGQIAVHDLATPDNSWGTVDEVAKKAIVQGPGTRAVKFLAFDGAAESGNPYGIGGPVYPDASKSRQNSNATATATAVIYPLVPPGGGTHTWYTHVTIHELMHALGASQSEATPPAPYATPPGSGNHCIDGWDALCYYSYGGNYCTTAAGYGTPVTMPIDCNKNTYFNAAPPGGSWLATYWNLAQPENPFFSPAPGQSAGATTNEPTSVGQSSATLQGSVTPNGEYASYAFEYGKDTSYGSIAPFAPAGTTGLGKMTSLSQYGSSPISVSAKISGLTDGGAVYHYRLVAINDTGQLVFGQDKTFKTKGPTIVTGGVTDFSPGAAVLHATVNPNGAETYCGFGVAEVGGPFINFFYGDAGSGTSDVDCSAQVTGLHGNRNYEYEAEAGSEGVNTVVGEVKTFKTPEWRPVVSVGDASAVTALQATLNGKVNPTGFATSYRFEYVSDADHKASGYTKAISVPASPKAVGSGIADVAVSETIAPLTPSTTYHYRLVATSEEGTTTGPDNTLTTDPSPLAVTQGATNVELTKATLTGIVNPESLSTTYQFEYGPTASYGTKVPAPPQSAGSGIADVPVSQPIEGLTPHSTYHFRLVATNSNGTTYGADREFFTGAWSTQATPNPVPYDQSLLEDTSCLSSTSCVAVGNDEYRGTAFVQTWNGSEWKVLTTVQGSSFNGISCSGNACLITGSSGSKGLTWKLGKIGGNWGPFSQLTTPTPEGVSTVTLEDVACSAETVCTAVGHHAEGTLAMRWNGTSWTIQTTPNPSGGEGSGGKLLAVSCPSATSCTAVGSRTSSGTQTFSERWNGTSWSIVSVPKPAGSVEGRLEDVSCATTSACMAVGWFKESTNIATPRKGLSVSWNGSAWSTVATAVPGGAENGVTLTGISCTAANACTAVGRTGGVSPAFPSESTLAEVWNGSAWAVQTTVNPLTYSGLSAVSCTSSSACTAVGKKRPESAQAGTQTLAERWNGSSWSTQATPNPVPYDQSLLEDTSCLSSTSCVAVGNDEYRGTAFVQTWNGSEWKVLTTVQGSSFNGISCSGNACLITGSSGSKGLTWKLGKIGGNWGPFSQLTTPTPEGVSTVTLEDVACSAETVCTAVGHHYSDAPLYTHVPLAMRWNGTSWTIQTTPNPSGGEGDMGKLLAVSCPSATSCTAVGSRTSSGTQTFSERWNGTSWSIVSVPKPAGSVEGRLEDVSCATTSACMAVGWFKESTNIATPRKGLSVSWNGSAWSTVATAVPGGAENGVTLTGISCTAANACTAVGRTGGVSPAFPSESTLAEVWNGSAWAVQTTVNPLTYSGLSAVSCTSSSACTAVGKKRAKSETAGTQTLAERWG